METKDFSKFRDEQLKNRTKQEDGTIISAAYSKKRQGEYLHTLMNDSNYVFTEFLSGPNNEQVGVDTKPGKDFKNAFADQAKTIFGLDDSDAGKIDSCAFSKKFADATTALCNASIATFLADRNKLRIPRTDPKQATISISYVDAAEKETPIRDISNGKSELTDDVSITAAHIRGRVENNTKHLKSRKTVIVKEL